MVTNVSSAAEQLAYDPEINGPALHVAIIMLEAEIEAARWLALPIDRERVQIKRILEEAAGIRNQRRRDRDD